MDSIEVTAKKVEDAVSDGLRQLSATLDEVDVKVLDTGGLFRKAKIVMSLTEEVARGREEIRSREEKKRERKEQFVQQSRNRDDNRERNVCPPVETKAEKPARQQEQKKEQPPLIEHTDKPQKVQKPVAERAVKSDLPSEVPEKQLEATVKFLKETLAKMDVTAEIKTEAHGLDLNVELVTDDAAVIGYHGETLDSLEYLAGLVANRDSEKYIKLTMDSNGFRDKQADSLVKLAEKMAAKCIKQGRKVVMEPMNSAARKVIHAVLGNNDKVVTKSEGKEPNRRVVIYCKREAAKEQ